MSEFYLRYEYHIASTQLVFAMLGMGATVRLADFMDILRFPRGFDLEPGLATGLVLVAAVPGGTMSNIPTYFAKANVPLSITLTAVATPGCLFTTTQVRMARRSSPPRFFLGSSSCAQDSDFSRRQGCPRGMRSRRGSRPDIETSALPS